MKIVICFKLSLNPDRIIEKDYENFSFGADLAYAGSELGCFDASSLEYGLKLKEQAAVQGAEVSCTALTVSNALPKSFSENLFAVGYDEVLSIPLENREFSPRSIAKLLAEEIKALGADLVLTGKEASLAETGAVPYYLSAFLGVPLLEDAESLVLEENTLKAILQRPTGTFKKEVMLPLVCSIGNSPEVLRYATLKARMKCRGKAAVSRPVPTVQSAEIGTFQKPKIGRNCKMLSADSQTLYKDVLHLLTQVEKTEQNQAISEDSALKRAVTERSLYCKISGSYEVESTALQEVMKAHSAHSLYLFADTAAGRKAALQLAESNAFPLFFGAEITALEENSVTVQKRVCASNLEWQNVLPLPAILTLPEADIKLYPFQHSIELSANKKPDYIKAETFLAPAAQTNLSSAALVVAAGAGMGTKENCDMARELAKALKGAFGLTRPAALNAWGAQAEIIGQSGTLTSPNCCLVLGAAGAGAFALGIEKAKTIIAVNTDESALIFKNADYGILLDAKTFTERLLKTLREENAC